jgi:hypothetical protein
MSNGGFTVRSAPGAGSSSGGEAPFTGGGSSYTGLAPQQTSGGEEKRTPQEELAFEETTTKISSPMRQMRLGLTEKLVGLGANGVQMVTTFYSVVQICVGIKDTTLSTYGPTKGLLMILGANPVYGLIGVVIAVIAQLLLQAGCQRISKRWKAEHITQHQDQRFGIIKVALDDRIGLFFTLCGAVLDAVSDVSFVYAFHIPWYVCATFGLLMNGAGTWMLYDGDERFHAAYMVWWRLEMAKKAFAQAVLEKARLMQGVSKDGRTLARQ